MLQGDGSLDERRRYFKAAGAPTLHTLSRVSWAGALFVFECPAALVPSTDFVCALDNGYLGRPWGRAVAERCSDCSMGGFIWIYVELW